MQSQEKNEKQQPATELDSAQSQELSEAWRALLGLPPAPRTESTVRQADPAAQELPQSSDPWSELVQVRGMETVDLQKIRLRELYPAASDEDVEHALNIIQEANGQSAPQEKKPGHS
jgi:hypothetical protein